MVFFRQITQCFTCTNENTWIIVLGVILCFWVILHSVEFNMFWMKIRWLWSRRYDGEIFFCFILHTPWNWNPQLSHTHVLLCGNPVETWLMFVYVNFFLQLCRNCGGNDSTARSTRPGILPYSSFNADLDYLNWLGWRDSHDCSHLEWDHQSECLLFKQRIRRRQRLNASTITICWCNAGPDYCNLLRTLETCKFGPHPKWLHHIWKIAV